MKQGRAAVFTPTPAVFLEEQVHLDVVLHSGTTIEDRLSVLSASQNAFICFKVENKARKCHRFAHKM